MNDAREGMPIDALAPDPDATRVEHAIVDGAIEDVYATVLRADFLRA